MIDDLQTLIRQRKNQTLDLYYHLGISINGCPKMDGLFHGTSY